MVIVKLKIDDIQKKADAVGVPFHNLLSGVILEHILIRLFESGFSRSVCVRNIDKLKIENYKKEAPLNIELQYFLREKVSSGIVVGKPISQEVLLVLAYELFPKKESEFLKWKIRLLEKGIYAIANLENYEIPVEIKLFESKEEDFFPIEDVFEPIMETGKRIAVRLYPVEKRLADDYLEIFEKLELLGELTPYMDVVDITETSFISGRKFTEYFVENCEKKNVALKEDRLNTIKSYVNNKHMLKKWKTFTRIKKIYGKTWENTLARACDFINPIWDAVCKEEVFFDDWMPELGKFM